MRTARDFGAENWADLLPKSLDIQGPPIDLHAVSRLSRVRYLGFRYMIPRGVLVPVHGGFEVYLRDSFKKELDLTTGEPLGALSTRQRFSLAHEIAHTRFYNLGSAVPCPEKKFAKGTDLESVCNRVAGHILMPTALLKREVREYGKEIDAEFVRLLASKFQTSLSVALRRLSLAEASSPARRCIVLLRRVQHDAEIREMYFGAGMLPILPRPKEYSRITEWLPNFPKSALDSTETAASMRTRMGQTVTFTRLSAGQGSDLLMEVQAA